jgi:predicted nucleic acid-binding protein
MDRDEVIAIFDERFAELMDRTCDHEIPQLLRIVNNNPSFEEAYYVYERARGWFLWWSQVSDDPVARAEAKAVLASGEKIEREVLYRSCSDC